MPRKWNRALEIACAGMAFGRGAQRSWPVGCKVVLRVVELSMKLRLLALALSSVLLAGGAQAQQLASSIPQPQDVAYPGSIRLDVDATNLSQRIFKIKQTIPAKPGGMTLLYPIWVAPAPAPSRLTRAVLPCRTRPTRSSLRVVARSSWT